MNRALGFVSAAVLATGCQSPEPSSVEGLWLSEGYGLVLEVAEGQVEVAEITAISCIVREDALVRVAEEANGDWRLQAGDDPAAAFLGLDSDTVARLKRPAPPPTSCSDGPASAPPSAIRRWRTLRR